MMTTAEIKVSFSLTDTNYRRSAHVSEQPRMLVTTTLVSPSPLSIELRGETDSGTVLENEFRMEHFEFFDLTTSTLVKHGLFPGTCDPGTSVRPDGVVELISSTPLETSQQLEDMSPLSDPVCLLEVGHAYRIRLKPQNIPGYAMSKQDLFQGRPSIPRRAMPELVTVELKSDDEVVLITQE